MAADELREAINLIKVGRMSEARKILEPFIIANPRNIQAWVWEIETCSQDAEKIKLMEACLQHNPNATAIKKALTSLKEKQTQSKQKQVNTSPFITDTIELESINLIDDLPIQAEESGSLIVCPHCGELISQNAEACKACGRRVVETRDVSVDSNKEENLETVPEPEAVKKKKWYCRTWFKVLAFILFMPLWCVIELVDPDSRKGVKIFSGVLLAFFVNALCFFLYWFITTNPSKANLLNWYQNLTKQSLASVPGGLVRVDGNVQNPGATDFSMIELQARVYDKDGNLLGNNTRYIDSSSLAPGVPTRFQIDVISLASSVNGGLANLQVLYYDDFSNPGSGWANSESEDGELSYFQGQYRIKVNTPNYDLWSNPGALFSDAKIEVDATKIAGPDSNRMGIQCRYIDTDNYYFAVISSDGYYGIGKVINGTLSFLRDSGMLVTDKVFTGSTANHIRFDCIGKRLALYINGDYVDTVEDDDLSVGDVGLLAGTFEKEGAQISFDNLVVTAP